MLEETLTWVSGSSFPPAETWRVPEARVSSASWTWVGGEVRGRAVSWQVPAHAIADVRRPRVSWLAARRVALGGSELEPVVVASWDLASS